MVSVVPIAISFVVSLKWICGSDLIKRVTCLYVSELSERRPSSIDITE